MNNEPVAYIDQYDLERLPHYDCYIGSQQLKNGIPLYTHPVDAINTLEQYVDKSENNRHDLGISHAIGFEDGFKAGMQRAVEMNVVKTLTDEEILEEWDWNSGEILATDLLDFADAILRKAQEK